MSILLWTPIILLVHTYFIYPLSLWAWDSIKQAIRTYSYLAHGKERRKSWNTEFLPQVTLIIAAYNEEECIVEKLSNSLTIQYPDLEIIVGSDGSTDATDSLVTRNNDSKIILSSGTRGGKSAVLNRCIAMAQGEIVVLTDANTSIDPQAVRRLVRHFANPQVGAVCGHLKLYNPTLPDYEESAYWSYESLLKHYESQSGVVMGANGGLYAIRRSLYNHLPTDTIIDDFTVPARILLAGYKVRFEPEALAYEKTTENYEHEFSRKSRISAGNFQALTRMPKLLFFLENPLASYAFWSHKFLRWLAPFFMLMALISNIFLLSIPGVIYPILLICQVSFYTLAGISRIYGLPRIVQTAASAAYYFVYMNLALAVGFWKFIRNQQKAAWERTSR